MADIPRRVAPGRSPGALLAVGYRDGAIMFEDPLTVETSLAMSRNRHGEAMAQGGLWEVAMYDGDTGMLVGLLSQDQATGVTMISVSPEYRDALPWT